MKTLKIKKGDRIRLKNDLPINDETFKETSPGWYPEMDQLIGKWLEVEEVEVIEAEPEEDLPEVAYITIKDNDREFYISLDWIKHKISNYYEEHKIPLPKVGDWVIYYESEEDMELATIGKVTKIEDDSWEVDGFGGYDKVFPFNTIEDLEKARKGLLI